MSIKEITYNDKVDLQLWGNVPDVNKIKADDMNEIKNIVNNNAKELILNEDNQIHIETEQSSTINVQDCSNLSAKIDVYGVSSQETRSGKNKLKLTNQNYTNAGLNWEATESEVKISGTAAGTYSVSNFFECDIKAGTYKFLAGGASNLVYRIWLFNSENEFLKYATSGEQFTITEDIVKYQLVFDNITAGNTYNTTFKPMILEATEQDKSFEQYGASPSPEFPSKIENVTGDIDITISNKNLFDGVFSQGYDSKGNITSSNQFVCNTNLIDVVENESYTISNNLNLKIASIAYYKDNEFVSFQANLNLATITIPQNVNQIRFNFYKEPTLNISDFIYCQFEKNVVATDYIEHEEQIITFPLQKGQKMYEGSYLAGDGIHHKEKQIELDGTENWFIGSIKSLRYAIRLELQDIKLKTTNLVTEILSNCFLPDGSSENSTGYENKFTFRQANGSRNLWFFIPKNFFTTTTSTKILEEWKAYLSAQKIAGTPVTIEYPLAEEEIEAYTEEQQEAYNQLQNAKTYKTVTNVFTDKALLEFKYIADTKTWVLNEIKPLKEQINTINELLSTANTSAMLLDNLQTDLESEVL